jgi:methionyl-tRNA formyltransferase
MDTGDILLQEELAITNQDTSGTIHDKLAGLASKLILDYLVGYEQIKPVPQSTIGVSYANKIDKSETLINWHEEAGVIERKIRGFNPFPGMHSKLNGDLVKIWQAELTPKTSNKAPGTIIATNDGLISVTCGEATVLNIVELQLAGKNRQLAHHFIQGKPDLINKVLV